MIDLGISKEFFYSQPLKPQTLKGEIDVFDYIQIKDFCLTKDIVYKIYNQLLDWDICFA